MTLKKRTFEKIVGKGKNAGNQHFPFSHNFFTLSQTNFAIFVIFELSSAYALNLDKSDILSFGKGIIKIINLLNMQTDHDSVNQPTLLNIQTDHDFVNLSGFLACFIFASVTLDSTRPKK